MLAMPFNLLRRLAIQHEADRILYTIGHKMLEPVLIDTYLLVFPHLTRYKVAVL
jgi:hypothetical protein